MGLSQFSKSLGAGMVARPGWSLLMVAHLPFTCIYFFDLWRFSAHYHFFPFAILAFVWLFATRRRDAPEKWGWFQKILVGVDLLFLIAGVGLYSPWMVAAGLVLSLLAWCSACEDREFDRRLTYLVVLPALLLRLPLNGDLYLTDALQSVTTRIASRLLLRVDYLHLLHGNVLEFADRRFLVEEACSGVQSLFTVLFLAALIVCWKRRTLAYAILFIPGGILFAGIMNVLRIVAIAIAWEGYKVDLSSGLAHDVIGYVSLTVAVGLLLSADMFCSFIADPVPDVPRPGPVSRWLNPLITVWNWMFGYLRRPAMAAGRAVSTEAPLPLFRPAVLGSGILCVLLLGVQGAAIFAEMTTAKIPAQATTQAMLTRGDLTAEISGFRQSDYHETHREAGNVQGEFSNSWLYQGSTVSALVSCDHPFVGWHQLQQCYLRTGWTLDSQDVVEGPDGWGAVVLKLSRAHGGEYGTVVYSHFDRAGSAMQPPELHRVAAMGLERLLRHRRVGLLDSISIQSQVFASTAAPITEEALAELLELHFQCREDMRTSISRQAGGR